MQLSGPASRQLLPLDPLPHVGRGGWEPGGSSPLQGYLSYALELILVLSHSFVMKMWSFVLDGTLLSCSQHLQKTIHSPRKNRCLCVLAQEHTVGSQLWTEITCRRWYQCHLVVSVSLCWSHMAPKISNPVTPRPGGSSESSEMLVRKYKFMSPTSSPRFCFC